MRIRNVLLLPLLVAAALLTACADVTAPKPPSQACGTGTANWDC
jgi:outer membrane biogenesis lipoprotein LolB